MAKRPRLSPGPPDHSDELARRASAALRAARVTGRHELRLGDRVLAGNTGRDDLAGRRQLSLRECTVPVLVRGLEVRLALA